MTLVEGNNWLADTFLSFLCCWLFVKKSNDVISCGPAV